MHHARYTPEVVGQITGTPQADFLKVCELIAETATPDRTMSGQGWRAVGRFRPTAQRWKYVMRQLDLQRDVVPG